MANLDPTNYQGGKAYGAYMEKWNKSLEEINESIIDSADYEDVEDLEAKLKEYKATFMECDQDYSGDLNVMDVKYLLQKLGQAKTHLEVIKMIREVDTHNTDAIDYTDFVRMMLGPKSSVLKLILMYEAFGKPKDKPTGVAPKRDLSSLP